jgi:ribosomal-protein-alanine N-acetyltransferase
MQLTVVGGGLTCLVAAIEGAELGWRVTVREARSTLGGTTTSRSWSSDRHATYGRACRGHLLARPSLMKGKMARMSLPTPTLRTARLLLRPFTSADADALFALHSSADVLRYWDAPPWSEPARAERFIAACVCMSEEGSGARLAIDRVSDKSFIGWCSLTRWIPDYRSASMAYCLDDAAWGHGHATEAGRALLQWAFDKLDLNRVQAETDTRNAASARVLEKLGFVREGTLREDCVVNGEVSDSWVYGLIRRQWRPSSEPSPDR